MQLRTTVSASAILAAICWGGLVHATPIPCPDFVRDQILLGNAPPEACCSYGQCKGDVVVQGG